MASAGENLHIQKLPDMCAEIFTFIQYLRISGSLEPSDRIYKKITALLSAIEDKAREARILEADVQDAKYAFVALIDETMRWGSRLGQEFFMGTNAGEEFFRKLDQLKESRGRTDVLRIYYLCLALGFEGKYYRTPEKLDEYIDELAQLLELKGVEKFSPQEDSSRRHIYKPKPGIPKWVPWVAAGTGVLIAVIVFIVLGVRMSDSAAYYISRIQNLIR